MIAVLLAALAQEPMHAENHLAGQTSPYLLQHVRNPVDWWPWSDAALAHAKASDKPIFLSIGYSACHWCHVMERESFENAEIAAFLNAHFVSIKVDREERPDLDDLYMDAVQRMHGSGGWPMTVFLTTDLHPFYGGTYFPPTSRGGLPGFLDVLKSVELAWRTRRADVEASARELGGMLAVRVPTPEADATLPAPHALRTLERAWIEEIAATFDPRWGGFGRAPKFPRTEDLRFLLAASTRRDDTDGRHARTMALHTLRTMAAGGMYDQIGGGFARYSVDAQWLIPHFEKMLYDQGTLIPAYLEAWQLTGEEFFSRIARECCDYLLCEMQGAEGGFFASTDADSEGEEGKFFAWTPAHLEAVLGAERAAFARAYYGVTEEGNFEHGKSVLRRALEAEPALREAGLEVEDVAAFVAAVRADLYAARAQRVPPHLDDKIVLSWNGLAVDALARAGRVLDEPRYVVAAERCARFLAAEMRTEGGGWHRTWRGGVAKHRAVLEDHAYLLRGLLALFQATGDETWLAQASELAAATFARFGDAETGAFWDTDGADASLLHRRQSPWDGATPSPNGVMLECLPVLHAFTQEERWAEAARRGHAAVLPLLLRGPRGFLTTARALADAVAEPAVAVVIGTGDPAALTAWRTALHRHPEHFTALPVFRNHAAPASALGLFAHREARNGKATLYLCRGATCEAPRTEP
jgi:uncharacterized protein YyaL (SSP411 family)